MSLPVDFDGRIQAPQADVAMRTNRVENELYREVGGFSSRAALYA